MTLREVVEAIGMWLVGLGLAMLAGAISWLVVRLL